MTTQVQKQFTPFEGETLAQMFTANERQIAGVVAKTVDVNHLVRAALLCARQDGKLYRSTKRSWLLALMECGQLSLYPGSVLGHAYLVPFKNGRLSDRFGSPIYDVAFIPGYRGLIDLAARPDDGYIVQAQLVHKADEFTLDHGDRDKPITHRPKLGGERGDVIGAYMLADPKTGVGPRIPEWMDNEELEAIKERTKSRDSKGNIVGPWLTDEKEMKRKTTVKRGSKYLRLDPMSQVAIAKDNAFEAGDMLSLAEIDPRFKDGDQGVTPEVKTNKSDDLATDAKERAEGRGAIEPEDAEFETVPETEPDPPAGQAEPGDVGSEDESTGSSGGGGTGNGNEISRAQFGKVLGTWGERCDAVGYPKDDKSRRDLLKGYLGKDVGDLTKKEASAEIDKFIEKKTEVEGWIKFQFEGEQA